MTTGRSIQAAYKEMFSKTHIGLTPSVPSCVRRSQKNPQAKNDELKEKFSYID